MASEQNNIKIKAVFLFPLTKSLKYQHERLSQETEKYEVEDVDDALEAGQVLSMESKGILFASDNKKLLKCLEKYEKLFLDSKYKIILVLPKRIIGKDVADLNNRGVQDILVEPITEKALTTKVDFNFKSIIKLIEAAEKKAKRAEELAKAREAAIEQKKLQDAKRKQKQEEFLKKKSIDSFWNEQDKAKEALMFKPVEGKIKDGKDNVLNMENSAASLNALNLYNNEIEAFQKTIKDKVEEVKTQNEEEKEKGFMLEEKDHIDAHIDGDKKNNTLEVLDSNEKNKKSIGIFKDPEIEQNLNGEQKNGEHESKHENNKKGLKLVDTGFHQKESEVGSTSTDNLEAHEKKKFETKQEDHIDKKFTSDNIEEDEIKKNEKSALIKESEDLQSKFDTGKNTQDHLEGDKNKSHVKLNEGDELQSKEGSLIKPQEDQIDPNQKSNINDKSSQDNKRLVGKNSSDQEEINQKGTTQLKESEDPNQKTTSNTGTEHQDDLSKNKSKSSNDHEDNLNKASTKGLEEQHNLNQASKTEQKDSLDSELKKSEVTAINDHEETNQKSSTNLKDQEQNLDKKEVKPISENVDKTNKGKGLKDSTENNEKSKGFAADNLGTHEKAKKGMEFNGEIKSNVELENNFVDEFSKKQNEEKPELVQINEVNAVPATHTAEDDLNSIVFDQPPQPIIKANLESIDIGIILLQKLSTSEQKIEEQSYIFPFIANKLYSISQGLITFYVVDGNGAPSLLYSSHSEHKDFYATLKLPPIDEYVAKNLPTWKNYRYSTLNDETLHADIIELIYPFKEGAKLLGFAIVHCYKTLKETKDISKLEMLIEFTRGYFMRFHKIGAQSSSNSKSKSNVDESSGKSPWYKKFVDQFNNWLNKDKEKNETKDELEKKSVKKLPTKKPPSKRGAA